MSSAEVINALFERTVDIVQSLPKTGPIQTSYEEKLALYSLYKQATEGDVRSKRPGMLDMLGRAKWDAWANRKGLGSQDAKQLYVESMLKTLRKFSDRPQAMQLIEELESFSGDVAQRVMSASLARAGGLDSEDDSQASSEASLSPRLTAQQRLPSGATTTGAYDTAAEDERDAVSQLPKTFTANRVGAQNVGGSGTTGRYPGSTSASVAAGLRSGQRTPMSVEGASAMAVRAGTATEGSYAGDSEEDRDVVTDRDPRRQSNPISSSRQPLRPGTRPAQGQSWQRSSGSLAGGESRLYALPNSARYPGPPASDTPGGGNAMGGGAGASLYSAIGPSGRPTPSEQHYYHRHGIGQEGTAAGSTRPYAPSSVGGRSGGGGGGVGQRAVRADVDMALQSIQASLAGLHERMNRVENRSSKRGAQGVLSGSGHFSSAYRALADALHDIAVLLGLRSDGKGGAAPSTYRGDGAESVGSRGTATARRLKGGNGGAGGRPSAWRTIMRLFLVLIQISVRVALDLTSVAVVLTLLLFLIKRTTGRGDPLLILRLLRTWLGVRVPTKAIAAAERVTKGGNE